MVITLKIFVQLHSHNVNFLTKNVERSYVMTTIHSLLLEPEFKILKLVAGESGLNRKLSGVNVIESPDLIPFCRPNELIVTTGIQMKDDIKQLEELTRHLYTKKVAGFIINVGPYIPEIPASIIQFSNDHSFPLLLMEWDYRVADLLKCTFEFIKMSQHSLHHQQNDQQLLSQLLFHYNNINAPSLEEQLQQRGFPKGAELGIITCTTTNSNHSISKFSSIIHYEFHHRYNHYLSLKHHNQLLFLINRAEVEKDQIPFSKTVEKIYEKIRERDGDVHLIIGMGNFYTSLKHLTKSYNESLTVIHLVQQHQNPFIYKYKEIGAYKIIMGVQDQSIIQQFHHDMLDPLYLYDQLHNTDFVYFLRTYLEENGSIIKISKRLFLHRNTVNYKIHKIEGILDVDLNHPFTRTNLNMAFMIEDVLNQQK